MGILGSIFSKIFPSANAGQAAPQATPAPDAQAAPSAFEGAKASATNEIAEVDVEAILNNMAEESPEKLNWRTSIVDLLKLLKLDSSLTARKALAQELHYTGDMNDSAPMNIWLHRQVMNKLAENGGKVPADLKD